jgi:hypothetical protein
LNVIDALTACRMQEAEEVARTEVGEAAAAAAAAGEEEEEEEEEEEGGGGQIRLKDVEDLTNFQFASELESERRITQGVTGLKCNSKDFAAKLKELAEKLGKSSESANSRLPVQSRSATGPFSSTNGKWILYVAVAKFFLENPPDGQEGNPRLPSQRDSYSFCKLL